MSKKHNPSFLSLVEEAKTRIPEVTVDQVLKMQSDGTNFVMVDVREESEWVAGHIEGATHLGKGIIERDIEKTIPDKDTVIVLYCGGGFRSALAAESLHRMGFRNSVSMDGGWREWNRVGGPIS
ncbi:MAG: sulfurtransferase [Deltaproteobacteria bacterium]|nr:sulfurtransferase [Deltaproteobacteria bacterium]